MELFYVVRLLRFSLGLTLLAGTLGGAAAPAAPFIAPVTFEGRRGCGSKRDAARITLTLRANTTYVVRIILNGREQFEGMGSWNVDSPGHKLVPTLNLNEPGSINLSVRDRLSALMIRKAHQVHLASRT